MDMSNFPQVERNQGHIPVLSPSAAAADIAPFEGELRSTFGAPHAEAPVRALQFARGASQAAGRAAAKKDGVEHLIHKKDGTIGERNSYGNVYWL